MGLFKLACRAFYRIISNRVDRPYIYIDAKSHIMNGNGVAVLYFLQEISSTIDLEIGKSEALHSAKEVLQQQIDRLNGYGE